MRRSFAGSSKTMPIACPPDQPVSGCAHAPLDLGLHGERGESAPPYRTGDFARRRRLARLGTARSLSSRCRKASQGWRSGIRGPA